MPVAEQVRVNTHTGNGSTTNFAYGFRIFEDTDLTVTIDGVVQTLTTHYTVNGTGDAGGGTIDFITAPINLSVVTISGELTYERETDYIQNGAMIANNFDNDFDYAIMLIQQNRRDIIRAIKVPIEETDDKEVSSTAANRADKALAFDSSGLPVASSITDLSSILTTVDTSLALSSGILSVAIPNRQAVAGGTVDAITATFVPVIAALANNIEVVVEAAGANATTTPTFAPDGLTAKTIVKAGNIALVTSDIPGANYRMHLVFDATLDKWVLLNPGRPYLPLENDAVTPTLAFGDGDSGFYEETDDIIQASLAGVKRWAFAVDAFVSQATSPTARMNFATTSATAPAFTFDIDPTTGVGRAGPNQVSLIAGGVEIARALASGLTIQVAAASPPVANTLSRENIIKGWIRFDGTGTPVANDSFNILSITDNGTGDYSIVLDTDFANGNYVGVGMAKDSSDDLRTVCENDAAAPVAGSIRISILDRLANLIDVSSVHLLLAGGQ